MTGPIYIENPPPFRHAPRGPEQALVKLPIDEGAEIVQQYLNSGLSIAGFHHADLDRYEALQLRHEIPPERYTAFEYAEALRQRLNGFQGVLIPHHLVVYEPPQQQATCFEHLLQKGISNVVLVGRPFSTPPDGVIYQATVEETLRYLRERFGDRLHLGVIGIHTRRGEAARIADKFEAADGRLRVMGQFLDDAAPMVSFMDQLMREFERRRLSLDGLEWNVGLAIFSLGSRAFYAKLLRQERLACEDRFKDLTAIEARIAVSLDLNLQFADAISTRARTLGLRLGYSIQPIIERYLDGRLHPAVQGAILLAQRLGTSEY